jgi:hypothetical protein
MIKKSTTYTMIFRLKKCCFPYDMQKTNVTNITRAEHATNSKFLGKNDPQTVQNFVHCFSNVLQD